MMNIHHDQDIQTPICQVSRCFALWIFFDFLFVWFEQQDVSCFTISLVMFLQEIKMNQRKILRTTHQTSQQTLFPPKLFLAHCDASGWSPVVSSRKLEWRLWQHIPAWPKPSFPSCHWAMGKWIGKRDLGDGDVIQKKSIGFNVDMVYLPTWMVIFYGKCRYMDPRGYGMMWGLCGQNEYHWMIPFFSTPVYSTDWKKLNTLLHVWELKPITPLHPLQLHRNPFQIHCSTKVLALWFPISFSSFSQFRFGQEHSQKSSLDCHTCHTYGYSGGLCYGLRLVDWTRVYCRCVTSPSKRGGGVTSQKIHWITLW